jgi:hypothetical protein
MVHSITVDMAGTTIIQQTPYINMWNSFKLMTSLSWADVATQGSTIGFYPDDPLSFSFQPVASLVGAGVCNNSNHPANEALQASITTLFNSYKSNTGNIGLVQRQQYINFDPAGVVQVAGAGTYASLISAASATQLWKSYIYNKVNSVPGVAPAALGTAGMLQIAVSATIYLKHLHSFFAMAPLLKGAFFKSTLNLNNTTTTLAITGNSAGGPPLVTTTTSMALTSVSNSVGGVNPLMMASAGAGQGAFNMKPYVPGVAGDTTSTFIATVQVGGRCLNPAVSGLGSYLPGPLAQSVFLYVPAYTFNPVFEEAYLSSPVKEIKYTDVYQYQVLGVTPEAQFNNLLTNGISDLRSVLLLPFYSVGTNTGAGPLSANTGLPIGIPVYQSPFDPAGTGPTSPLCLFSNFNVVVSGQNAIYNTERYSFEHFNNQLYGANAVNAGMTDGLTSGLFNSLGFEMEYSYWYTNVSRMLPVEASVPKSVQIVGTNKSMKAVDLWCFLEYGCSVSVDILTGSRV